MWKNFSAHHIQRGDVTAVVWGAPGAAPEDEGGARETPVRPSAPAAGTADAEELTRGRRAGNPFVQQCDFIFPLPERDSVDADEEAESQARAFVVRSLGTVFYYRARGSLSALLEEPFLGSYILRGGFSALALNAPSDQGNSFAILPNGVLLLSLDRESFQTLGLPGEAAPTRPKGKAKRAGAGAGSTGGSAGVLGGGAGGPDRYVSAIDLSTKAFRRGKPLHDRVISCLGGGSRAGGGGGDGFVEMLVCSWEEPSRGGSRRIEEGGVATANLKKSGLSRQGLGLEGEGMAASSTAAGGGSNTSGQGGHVQGSYSEQRESERKQEQCCREVNFPPGFSTKKVEISPDIRFFTQACCPDLDLVGHGFASTATFVTPIETPPLRKEEGGGVLIDGATVPSDGFRENTGDVDSENNDFVDAANDASSDHRSGQLARIPPAVLSPPGSTKCRLVLDMFEWLGAVSCGLDAVVRRQPSPPEPFLSEFETPRHLRYRRNRVVCRARLRGFLPPLAVARFVKAAGSAASSAMTAEESGEAKGGLGPQYYSSLPADHACCRQDRQRRHDGSAWGSVTAWPFRDAPRGYPGAYAPCAGGQTSKRGGRGRGGKVRGRDGAVKKGAAQRSTREWPVGGHGCYTVVACPGETAVAYVSARCPGPGW